MNHRTITAGLLASAALLGGCDRLQAAWTAFGSPAGAGASAASDVEAPARAEVPAATSLTPGTPGDPVAPATDNDAQMAASVVEVHDLAEVVGVSGKIYGDAGGDPAMNGLHTWLALYRSPADGWWVFPIGDVLSVRILGQSKGRIDLELRESVMDEATSEIGDRTRRIVVLVQPGATEEHSPVVRIAPAT